ncbi:MAG: histidine phosphatase family protein [bacterium]|nr:histidine phosphatase family protein [bacterium]
MRTRLLLLRHGAVDWTRAAEGEPPLAAEGLRDVEIMAATLPHFNAITASPQSAARETAEIISQARGIPVAWREGLNEIMTAAPLTDAQAWADWADRLFESYRTSMDGESLADGTQRITAELRTIGDLGYGRTTLVVSHPIILLAFRAHIAQTAVMRDQVDGLPDLGLAIVDYLEGRFYLVEDFPVRR